MRGQRVRIKMRENGSEHKEQGQALVEFALLVTFLTFLLMGLLAFGIIFSNQLSLFSTAKLAARKATMNTMRHDYCDGSDPNGHLNSPIYDTVINNLGGLEIDKIHDILIFVPDDATGKIRPNQVDVLYANGSEATGCYDYNHDGSCDCSCPGGTGCVHDLCANTFKNSMRCDPNLSIGVEVRYDQDVVVPIVNAITGDVIVVPARVVMHVED